MNATIPTSMQAVQIDRPRGQLSLREVPVPQPGPGQVLVRMAAAPINPSDLGALTGIRYSGKASFPFTPGKEGSGTVVAAGAGFLPSFLKGKRVACAATESGGGTWAEYTLTSALTCIPLNKKVSLERGCMLLVNPLTAIAIFDIARSGRHKAVVSTAAASALGGMLISLAKKEQIALINVVHRQAQVDALRQRGAEYVLNSTAPDFDAQLKSLAARLQATLILDAVSGEMTARLVAAAPSGSTILLYSNLSQQDSTFNAVTALSNNLTLQGFLLTHWFAKKNFLQILLLSQKVQSLVTEDFDLPVRKRLPLAAAQEGLEMYLADMSAGKILLVADPQAVPL
jgi:NADPH:quinone reductase-like Zn-dependent oxidoreductase